MNIKEFLEKLPIEKREIYRKVYEADGITITNAALAEQLNITLSMLEQIRHDLFAANLIKKKKNTYRKSAGLSPSRKKINKDSSALAGLTGGKTRHTFIIDESNLEKLRLLAHLDHKKLNEFLNDLLSMYFTERQKDVETAMSLRENSSRLKLRIDIK
ncbi:MAG: hypothetical protein GX639_05905 [Fibrobacter sp.]|nr:hypothetical protein [Fibrobacter sp.]